MQSLFAKPLEMLLYMRIGMGVAKHALANIYV